MACWRQNLYGSSISNMIGNIITLLLYNNALLIASIRRENFVPPSGCAVQRNALACPSTTAVRGKIWQSSTSLVRSTSECSASCPLVSFRRRSWDSGLEISRDRVIYRTMATVLGRVIVYGGKGALGSACVSQFKSQNWVSNGTHESHYPRIRRHSNWINRAALSRDESYIDIIA